MKKIPMRQCVVTKEKLPKMDMFRVVISFEKVVYDKTGKLNGKGAYLKKDKDVINLAKKNKILNRILGVDIPDSLYDELIENI